MQASNRSSYSKSPVHIPMNFPRKSSHSSLPASLYSQVLCSANLRRRKRAQSSVDSPTTPISREKAAGERALRAAGKRQLRRTDWALCVLAGISVYLGFLDSDIYWHRGREETGWLQWLRLLEWSLTVCMCKPHTGRCLYQRYTCLHSLRASHPASAKYERFFLPTPLQVPFFSSPLVWSLLLEVLICTFPNPPFVNCSFSVESLGQPLTYSLNDVITCLLCLRLYLVARLIAQKSPMLGDRPSQWCYRFGVAQTPQFGLKWTLHFRPLLARAVIVLTLTGVCAAVIRIWERAQDDSELGEYVEDWWLVFVTSTTVGFGDLAPSTHIGRGVAVFACLGGSLYLGLLVQGIQQLVTMTPSEEQAYAFICQRELLYRAKREAGRVISTACYILYHRHQPRNRAAVTPMPRSTWFAFKCSPHYPAYRRAVLRFRLLQSQAKNWSTSDSFTLQRIIAENNCEMRDILAKCTCIGGSKGHLGLLLGCTLHLQRSVYSC